MKYDTIIKRSVALMLVIAGVGLAVLMAPAAVLAEDDHDHESEVATVEADEHHDEEEGHEEGTVHLSPAEIAEYGLQTAIVGPGHLLMSITVPGEIVVNNDRLAHIAPRFAGVVKEVRKHVGDNVKRGEVLAVVESNEALTDYQVTSLLEGTVIEKHITVGEVRSEDDPAFCVADLDTVWVNFAIYQMDLPHVREGQRVVVSGGPEYPESVGEIAYLSPVVDEHTRTATARTVLPNLNRQWRPGMFVRGTIDISKLEVELLVPKTALQTLHDHPVIFVEHEEGFVATPVKVGRSDAEAVEILDGLHPSDKYVSYGGFALKAELLKAGFDDGHNH